MSNFFVSILGFAVGLFFVMLGILSMMIPWEPGTRTAVVLFIFENSLTLVLFGFTIFVLGLFILINQMLGLKRRTYTIRGGSRPVTLDESVIQDYINSYWRESYPAYEIPSRLSIKKNKIHIYADLPYVPRKEQKELLNGIRNDLTDLFSRHLGYHNPFYLSASFQRSPNRSRILTNE